MNGLAVKIQQNSIFLLLVVTALIGLQSVHAQSNDYKISAGDKISILVYGEQELSFNEISIPKSGVFSYPFLGEIIATGKTESELTSLITSRLKDGYLLDPQVTVSIATYRPIYIGGAVDAPGRQEFLIDMDVEKVIAVAGGLTKDADPSAVVILRDGEGGRTEIQAEMRTGVAPGDVITIGQKTVEDIAASKSEKLYIYLYGEVNKPGRYEYTTDLSVEKAIVIAGGFGARASKRKISVSRGNPAKIKKKVPLDYQILPGDVITIGASLF